jgi:PAS domain S-box-containing protein
MDDVNGFAASGVAAIEWPAVLDRLREGLVIAEVVHEAGGALNWRYLYVNRAWSDLTGLSAEGVPGRLVTEVIPGVERNWLDDFANVALRQQTRRFVGPVSQLGRSYDIHAFPVSATQFGLLFVDVTEREASEAGLKARAASLERAIKAEIGARVRTWDVSPDLQAIANGEGYFEQVNPAWTTLLGYGQEELTRIPFMDLVHPEDRHATREAYRRTRNDEPVLRFVNRYRHADGSYRWLSWVSVPEGGRIYCTARDITAERARAEELELRRAERNVYWTASPDLHVILTLDGICLEASDAWRATLGHDPGSLKGRRLGELVHREDRAGAMQLLHRLRKTGALPHSELRICDAAGTPRWFGWTAAIRGNLILATGRDIDDHLRRAEQLRQAEEALRQTHQLETLGQLTGGVAHDFNNLLMAVQSNLTLLRQQIGCGTPQAQRLLDNAQAAADRGKSLVSHMLAFARRQDLAPAPTDCRALIERMNPLLDSSLGPGMEVCHRFEAGLPAALVDATQLEIALLNLAVNASDAADGRGRLTIAARRSDGTEVEELAPGDYVALSVADDGPGMDSGTLAQAMEPFFTTKGVGKGTGLGLSMVHGLARQSGGAFVLKSAPGGGTTAEIYLPVASAVVAERPEPAVPEAPDRPLRLLVVDDDILVLMGTVGMLEDLGHEVVQATGGADALAAFEADPGIDMVLTDQAMPRMSGVQLAEELRRRRPDLPIVLCTGYSELPAGAERFITARLGKPFADRQIAEIIAQARGTADRPAAGAPA